MAIVSINYDCGCRFHGKTVEEAIAHVDETGHELNVAGVVKPSVQKVRNTSSSYPVKRQSRPRTNYEQTLDLQAEDTVDFGKLRDQIKNR